MEVIIGVVFAALLLLSVVGLITINSKNPEEKYAIRFMVNSLCILAILATLLIIGHIDELNFYKNFVEERYVMVEIDGITSYYEKNDSNVYKIEEGK